ncbi:hypothetical protein K2173_022221 [Erythroxylum novogranatense]|uniref:Uncharacterized protein n=1 Tax=Erythroxylum novogranatense TaxID=1862640 RepID=A0AAV8SUE0_9ROSI|nr:hypothetical protein K2173_022221 [Erythroxylum novogranatense]
MESFTRQRLKVCRKEEDWEMIEKKLGCGQWDPWGVPDDYECEVVEDNSPVPKHVPLHRPGPLPEEFYKTLRSHNHVLEGSTYSLFWSAKGV